MKWIKQPWFACLVVLAAALGFSLGFRPLPPLLKAEESAEWVRLTEFLGLDIIGLVILCLMGVLYVEIGLSASGIKIGPAARRPTAAGDAPEPVGMPGAQDSSALAIEVAGLKQDLALVAELVREELEGGREGHGAARAGESERDV